MESTRNPNLKKDKIQEFILDNALLRATDLEKETYGKPDNVPSTNQAIYNLKEDIDPIAWINEATTYLYVRKERLKRNQNLTGREGGEIPYLPMPGSGNAEKIKHQGQTTWKIKRQEDPLMLPDPERSREASFWVTYKTPTGKRFLLLIFTFDPTHAFKLRTDPKTWQDTKKYWTEAGKEQGIIRTQRFDIILAITGIDEWLDAVCPKNISPETWKRRKTEHREKAEAGKLGLDIYHSNFIQCFAWSIHEKQKHKDKARAELEQNLTKKVNLFDAIYGNSQSYQDADTKKREKIEVSETEASRTARQFWENTLENCYTTGSDIHLIPRRNDDASIHIEVKIRRNQNLFFYQNIPPNLCKDFIRHSLENSEILHTRTNTTQDGRKSWFNPSNEKTTDLRISVTPTGLNYPLVVMRMLDTDKMRRGIDDLGLNPLELQIWNEALNLPQSLILVGGRTNSGKSATLYAALLTIHKRNNKKAIATIEDPKEYQLPFGVQIPVSAAKTEGYSGLIQQFMRNDGNVIMLGEIRDAKTAKAALELGLTGNQILSTIHSNSTAETALRLYEWGMEPYTVSEVTKLLCSQRLAGTPCPHCLEHLSQTQIESLLLEKMDEKKMVEITQNLPENWAKEYGISQGRWGENRGCASCEYTGIQSMTALQELLVIDDYTKPMLKKAEIDSLRQAMKERGIYDMETVSWRAAWLGRISIKEALAVSKNIRSAN